MHVIGPDLVHIDTVNNNVTSVVIVKNSTAHRVTKECILYTDDILNKKSSLIGHTNKVRYNFRKVNCQSETRLVKTHCTCFYGAALWNLTRSNIESICIALQKGISGEGPKAQNQGTKGRVGGV